MNQRFQDWLEQNPWAAPFVVVVNWGVAACEWLAAHSDALSKSFALAGSMLGLGVMWYTFRIKRREFRRGEPPAVFPAGRD